MKFNKLLNLAIFSVLTTGTMLQNGLGKPLNIAISVTLGSKSHAKYLLEISEKLINRGHSITYLCTEDTLKFSKGYNITHKTVSNVDLDLPDIELDPFVRFSKPVVSPGFKTIVAKIYTQSFPIYEKYYKEEKPDLIICDFISPSCIESAAKYSIPLIIGYQSLSFTERKPYLTISNGLKPTTIENYSFWDRFNHGIIDPIKDLLFFYPILSNLNQVRKEFGIPEKVALTQFTNMGLGLANSYIGFENPRSLSSHVFPIGPIVPDTLPQLSQELNEFLNSRQKILYIAFGSLIKFKSNLSTNMLEHFQRLLNEGWIDGIIWGGLKNTKSEEFPKSYTVNGVEYSTEKILEGAHDDFKFLKWAPQDAILNHENVKLFITHAGLDSIYESVQSGTPMLAIPFFMDQPRNAVLIKEHGIGDYIEWPLDGDRLIHKKMVNLLDPENSRLKSKLEQFQRISQFSSNRKLFAADLIETYAYSAKTCRLNETPKSFEIPCEVKPFLSLDHQISPVKANLIDVYAAGIVILLAMVGLVALVIGNALSKLYRYFGKLKKD
ncbi:glycosyltransferase family 1 protein [Conidiobolus coronatus NRRL 28638]|uniref:Glycosyltransferase family 1 protein n=1 Tax=Conidiobolus coronatus (strain ATCC 28846 / CBS 209.66 / NRRL 28638) TaxID=796925 RepID=A0A137NXY0_CONC2|nr:glycosyltransferase family 1 protein [Conidiobolus coronatus NRRL 28638]|eukprot:KXN67514.1 glycosyltransferase family 1 protein [Conidiobolus coronatus NRRL 28638]